MNKNLLILIAVLVLLPITSQARGRKGGGGSKGKKAPSCVEQTTLSPQLRMSYGNKR